MKTLSKEQKRELRERAIEQASNIPAGYLIGYTLSFPFILIVLRMLEIEPLNGYYWVIGIISVLMLFCIFWVLYSFLLIYKNLKKEEEERIKKSNIVDGCFYQGDIWVTPKYHKEYSDFFENLSDFYEIKYYASFTEKEKIKIFIMINGEEAIEFEEIEKADFLDFYQINKAKL